MLDPTQYPLLKAKFNQHVKEYLQWFLEEIQESPSLGGFIPYLRDLSKEPLHPPSYYWLHLLTTMYQIDQNFLEKKLKELKRRGFLKEEGGYYRASNLFLETPRDKASENLKEINAAFLDQAKQALLEQNIETRDISHMMLTISKSELPMIKNYLNELRREFNRKATKGEGEKDAVYCLGLSFFELSKTFKK